MSAIESNVMVSPLNDSNNFKRIDTDNWPEAKTSSAEKSADEMNPVTLSDISKQMAALKEYILTAPDINKARVEFLKEELSGGRYRIGNDQIAMKMFADVEIA
ncbi:flagellar biosynthesis anti-sigma factor FlgM [Legionella fairfieldensis]|uniref:flagellar biosynthesis anti-sigma factor FlgM n=1 Tax=Legionella fairfieldensis TaxID=45064 RepID=UPI00048FE34A|nr:flagellar biosynthesis anti-sigma factor FlgM [Legionella fairfieldensis]